jgi:hypothetical protein
MACDVCYIVNNFAVDGEIISAEPYGNGHINDTRLVRMKEADGNIRDYILQKINKNVFKDPASLMENYVAVTEFIRNKVSEAGGDPEREVVNAIMARDGKSYVVEITVIIGDSYSS